MAHGLDLRTGRSPVRKHRAKPCPLISGSQGDCSIATGADSKIARQEQGETTWDPLNASELAPQLGERLNPKPNCVGQVPTAR
jgi:hypothetical protein